MINFNFSVDFELGWGDLDRVAVDNTFYRRVVDGQLRTLEFIGLLDRYAIKSTWGVVGACCFGNVEELRLAAPQSFLLVENQLDLLMRRRGKYSEVLFCRPTIEAIARSANIELASHGFLHLVARANQLSALREDAGASVRALTKVSGESVRSFIAPRNFFWPDELFAGTGIKYVRHTPDIFGQKYSDTSAPAKFARLWNDFIRPVRAQNANREAALLVYLRIDRGRRLWSSQLRLIRSLLKSRSESIYCYTHPHNIDTSESIKRLGQLFDLVGELRDKDTLVCPPFAREVTVGSEAAVSGARMQ